jgi:uncharacterized membrane protein
MQAADVESPARPAVERARKVLRWLLALVFLVAGAMHLHNPEPFVRITPGWVPHPQAVIAVTGLCELLGAVGLMTSRLRRWAGLMLATYTVCVYPANIKHAVEHIAIGHSVLGWWYHAPRLAFQPVFFWWCLFAGGLIDWPWLRGVQRASRR